jgi:hypothetical protein
MGKGNGLRGMESALWDSPACGGLPPAAGGKGWLIRSGSVLAYLVCGLRAFCERDPCCFNGLVDSCSRTVLQFQTRSTAAAASYLLSFQIRVSSASRSGRKLASGRLLGTRGRAQLCQRRSAGHRCRSVFRRGESAVGIRCPCSARPGSIAIVCPSSSPVSFCIKSPMAPEKQSSHNIGTSRRVGCFQE